MTGRQIMVNEIIIHPKIHKLRQECEEFKQTLVGLIGEHDKIKFKIFPTIETFYQAEFGRKIAELLRAEFEVAAMKYRIEKVQTAINHGESVSPERIESEIESEFDDWQKRIAEQEFECEYAEEILREGFLTAEETRELNQIYRDLARKLHPDVAENYDERKKDLWLMVSEAYQESDLERLKGLKIVCELEAEFSDEKYEAENSIERLEKELSKLKTQVEEFVFAIEKLRKSETYILGENLKDSEWVAEQHDIFKMQIKTQKETLEDLEALFQELLREVLIEERQNFRETSDDWDEIIL